MARYIQYGCGLSCPQGWVNYDVSPRLRFERLPGVGSYLRKRGTLVFPEDVRFGNIVSGLPEPNGVAQGVFCSHVLEHLDRESVLLALSNTLRLMAPGGVFRLVVPCLEWRARRLIFAIESGDPKAVDLFMESSHLGVKKPLITIRQRMRAALGNSAHRWMYDARLMKSILEETGFCKIRQCKIGDSEDRAFDLVEDVGRFFEEGHAELAVEARRPSK